MKKLMFAIAAVAAGTVLADVTSANIVGYQTIEADATDYESAYPTLGMTFVPVSGEGFTLSDFKPVEGTFSSDDDLIQVIDPNTLEASAFFSYCGAEKAAVLVEQRGGKAEDYIGWYDLFLGDIGDQGARADDYPIKPGDGFIGFFFGGNKVQFTCAGEAPTATTDYTTDGGESYYPTIVNYIPKTIPLKKIVPVEGTYSSDDDLLQIIDPITLEASAFFAYCGAEKAAVLVEQRGGKVEDYIGWYDLFLGDIGDQSARADDYPVNAGSGFMGFFFSEQKITFQFPSSLD